jgi:hypothetical protein
MLFIRLTQESLKYPLLHPELEDLTLTCEEGSLFPLAANRLAHLQCLKRLSLDGFFDAAAHVVPVVKALGSLAQLTNLIYDAHASVAPSVFKRLTRHPTLESITYHRYPAQPDRTFILTVRNFTKGEFALLKELRFILPGNDFERIGSPLRSHDFSRIQRLVAKFNPDDDYSPEATRNSQIFQAIADTWPSVNDLIVQFCQDGEDTLPVTFANLGPTVWNYISNHSNFFTFAPLISFLWTSPLSRRLGGPLFWSSSSTPDHCAGTKQL